MWKNYINVVSGLLSFVLILGAVLWFWVEPSPEPALAFASGLLALFTWLGTRETELRQVGENSNKVVIPVHVDGYQSDKHREADLNLLREVWQILNVENFERFTDGVEHRRLKEGIYHEFHRYVKYYRQRPDFYLINKDVEALLSYFDEKLKAFPEFKFAKMLGIVLEKLKQSQVQSVILTHYFSGIA